MEYSLGGSGYRPTINSYQYGDAMAIARAADILGQSDVADLYRRKAQEIKRLVQDRLWDRDAQFFKTLPRGEGKKLADVRELVGFVPWYFNLPDPGFESAWKQLTDSSGFAAPFGPTTAERRAPGFMEKHDHDCLWNGPSWPYATTQTLVALANLLHDYQQHVAGKDDYLALLRMYARSQYKDGKPWIAENLDPLSGNWIVDKTAQRRLQPFRLRRPRDYRIGRAAAAGRRHARSGSPRSRRDVGLLLPGPSPLPRPLADHPL